MIDGEIRELISVVHLAGGTGSGMSSHARLSLSGALSAARPALAPLWAWALAVFRGSAPDAVLERVWRRSAVEAVKGMKRGGAGSLGDGVFLGL